MALDEGLEGRRHVEVLDVAGIPVDLELVVGVITASGEWPVGVQLAPDHVPPEWPDGAPQQVHLDLHVEDPRVAHVAAIGLGARLLQPGDFDAEQGHQVYADPAGHPFCIGWGHPSRDAVAALVASRSSAGGFDSGRD
jgi:hypothetical protein